ncbi:hypothetical protein LCGC14_1639880 [marine sediment metagenome]|uniref:Streptomycin biosynthesis protein StrF domain-containing protein n=1 Tax=marine sediment metagenome TaxID=412755 RepID=A0A0F9IMF1_9ZZZZ
MTIVVPSMVPERAHKAIGDWRALMAKPAEHQYLIVDNSETNRGVLASMQEGYEKAGQDIIMFAHDDVEINEENWDTRVEAEFNDPSVGVVGFGGALYHGDPDIYKVPYYLQQLGRSHYRSNTTDAESHGERFTGSCDVATLDGFALIVRKELLDKAGGFPVDRMTFHSYDYWVCCMAHRLGYRVRVVGIKCQHLGGRTSTTPAYQEWIQKTHKKTDVQVHEESHRFVYDEFFDVLPWRCQS